MMNLLTSPKSMFKTPRKSGKVANTCAPRQRKTATKAEIRLQRRVDAFEKSAISNDPGYKKPGSLAK